MSNSDTISRDSGRDLGVDALRGLAMTLVVVGHTLGAAYPSTYLYHPAQVFLYSFHLPLFAAVSGYLTYGRDNQPGTFLMKRFRSLLVPYFTWFVIWWSVARVRGEATPLGNGLLEAALSPRAPNALWFLYGLFLVNVIFVVVRRLNDKPTTVLWSMFAAAILFSSGALKGIWLLDLERVCWLYIFFALGYMTGGPWRIQPSMHRLLVATVLPVYVTTLILTATIDSSGTRVIDDLINGVAFMPTLVRALLILAGTSACCLLWVSAKHAPAKSLRPLAFIGSRSTGIYAMHKRLAYLVLELGATGFWIPFMVAMGLSTTLSLILERVPVVAALTMGRGVLRATPRREPTTE